MATIIIAIIASAITYFLFIALVPARKQKQRRPFTVNTWVKDGEISAKVYKNGVLTKNKEWTQYTITGYVD